MQVGDQIDHYTIIEHIGRGGMADVWSARDERLHRTVAVKTIMADLTDERARAQFEHEARTIAALEHSNILPIYDFGEYQRQLYIVMRYVAGGSLMDRIIDQGWLPDEVVLDIGGAIARALERAHAESIVHRDLKPANVLLDRFGTPYLADFGLAAVAGVGEDEGGSSGTLIYMPPEQVMGGAVDHRADVYAFAVMLFQMLTGEFPFDGQTALCLQQIQFHDQLPDPREYRPDLPEELAFVLRMATAMDVSARYDSAGLLMNEVTAALRGRVAEGEPTAEPTGPPPEAVPYRAETDLHAGVDEDLIVTMHGVVDEELLATHRVDSTEAARRYFQRVPPDSGDDLFERIVEGEGALGEVPGLREVRELFQRMVRAWARGQGRFLTGATHFATIHDYYSQPDVHGLPIDDAGREAMLRGAIEHHYELEFWLAQVPSIDRRRVIFLHALRSDLAAARALAVRLLRDVPDGEMANVALTVGRLLHAETSVEVRRAVVELLAHRGERPAGWHTYAFNRDTDLLLAEQAVREDAPEVAELAARTIGQLRSQAAVMHITSLEGWSIREARAALTWVRDEADSLPPEVPFGLRARAFTRLTVRYLSADMGRLGLRYFLALLGSGIGLGLYIDRMFPSSSILQLLHLYRVIGNAQTFGLVAGLGLTLAAALPLRLAGSAARRPDGATLWRWWARLLVGLILGCLVGTVAYLNFQVIALSFTDPKLPVVLFGGLGMALGAAVGATFRWPLGVRLVAAALTAFAPLAIAWEWSKQGVTDAIIFLRGDEQLWLFVVMGLLMALGAFGPEVLGWWRATWRRWRGGALKFRRETLEPAEG